MSVETLNMNKVKLTFNKGPLNDDTLRVGNWCTDDTNEIIEKQLDQ